MTNPDNIQTKENRIDDEIVAYLDGELSSVEAEQIEKRLANEPKLRNRLAKLQKTWDLLDTLPRPETTNGFTKSTMELVVSEARREVRKNQKGFPQWLLATGLLAVFAGLCGWLSYVAVDKQKQLPQREIIDQVDTIEFVSQYRDLDSVEFLKKLREEEVFIQGYGDLDFKDAPGLLEQIVNYGDSYDQIVTSINALDDKRYRELCRKVDVFNQLPETERERIIEIDRELRLEPNRTELLLVLSKYHEWLKTLSVSRRSDFRDTKDFDARIQEIRTVQAEQESETFGIHDSNRIKELSDLWKINIWFRRQTSFRRTDDEFKEKVSSRGSYNSIDVIEFITATGDLDRIFTEESISDLRKDLSEDTNFILEYSTDEFDLGEKRSLEDQRKLILQWVKVHVIGPQPTISDLNAFFDQLSEDDKKELDGLSAANRLRELRRLFRTRRRNEPSP